MPGGFSILALTFWHLPPSAGGAAPNGADDTARKDSPLSAEENKAIVGRWFTEFWGPDFNPAVIDELAAPDIRFEYSLHAPLRGRDAVRDFAAEFRAAFPDLAFGGTADLIAEGDYVVGQWIGGGTHTGDPMTDLPLGGLAKPNTGKTMRFTGITILKVENGMITEEVGLDDGVSVLRQLGLIAEG
jgi:predicted ester cyclase